MRSAAFVMLACVLPRLAYLAATPLPDTTHYYWRLSTDLLRHRRLADDGITTTAFEPLYPLFLAGARFVAFDRLALVLCVQIGVSALGGVCLFRLTERLSGSRRAAFVAALLYAGYPYLIRQSVAIIEVTLFTTLLIAACDAIVRVTTSGRAVVAGVVLGLAALTRFAALPFVALALVWLAWRRGLPRAAVAALMAATVLSPFLARNYLVDGSIVPPRSGLNLYVGNCEWTERFLPTHDLDLLTWPAYRLAAAEAGVSPDAPGTYGSPALDAILTRHAVAFIREDPARALRQRLRNVWYFFHPRIVPFLSAGPWTQLELHGDGTFIVTHPRRRSRAAESAHSAVYTSIALLACVGLYLRRSHLRGEDAPLLLAMLTTAAVCALYAPTTRLRAAVDFVLMFYGAVAVDRVLGAGAPLRGTRRLAAVLRAVGARRATDSKGAHGG